MAATWVSGRFIFRTGSGGGGGRGGGEVACFECRQGGGRGRGGSRVARDSGQGCNTRGKRRA